MNILRYFEYDHLNSSLWEVSKTFYDQARYLDETLPASAEKTIALRKLLESKDAAIRAALDLI